MDIQNIIQGNRITLDEAIRIAFDIIKSKTDQNQRFELNSPTQGLRIYSRDRVRELIDVKRTLVTEMEPHAMMANGETGWSFTVEEIIANDEADSNKRPYDVTVMTSCAIRVYAENEDGAREKVNTDSHVRALVRHYMRENGIEVTDVQEAE